MSVLGVPVDYRLREIIQELIKLKEASISSNPSSNHSENLRQLSQFMRDREWSISENEVDFACYLVAPEVYGGIVVALTQSPQNQVYSLLVDDVVEDYKTLLCIARAGRVLQPSLR
jgi:hypothetical protein